MNVRNDVQDKAKGVDVDEHNLTHVLNTAVFTGVEPHLVDVEIGRKGNYFNKADGHIPPRLEDAKIVEWDTNASLRKNRTE